MLFKDEAIVGRDQGNMKRLRYHSKGRFGIMTRRRSRLTIILKQLEPKDEKLISRTKLRRRVFRELKNAERKLLEFPPNEEEPTSQDQSQPLQLNSTKKEERVHR